MAVACCSSALWTVLLLPHSSAPRASARHARPLLPSPSLAWPLAMRTRPTAHASRSDGDHVTGHGGGDAADLIEQHLGHDIAVSDAFQKLDFPNALRQGIESVQERVCAEAQGGACVVAALLHGRRLAVAWVGDCRAIICQDTEEGGKPAAIALTHDHDPADPEIRKQIEARGGAVDDDKFPEPRVYLPSLSIDMRVFLAVGKAIGDTCVEPPPFALTCRESMAWTPQTRLDCAARPNRGPLPQVHGRHH